MKSKEEIIQIVCDRFEVTFEELASKRSIRRFCEPKQIIYYFLYRRKKLTCVYVANLFNRKQHGGVLHGAIRVEGSMDMIPSYKKMIDELKVEIGDV